VRRGAAAACAAGPVRMLLAMDDPQPRRSPGARPLGRWLASWLPVVAWAAVIFLASAQPNLRFVPVETLDLVVRKVGHMAVFGILALLIWRAMARTTAVRRPWAWGLALAGLYAITDEIHQAGVPGRNASAVDVAIDATGAVIAIVVARVVLGRRRRVAGDAGDARTPRG
jgi:hypothetical protein